MVHSVSSVWIGGKGPSLLTYDWSEAGEWRVGINEAVQHIPGCKWGCAVDRQPLELYNTLALTHVITSERKRFPFRSDLTVIGWDKAYQSSGPAAIETCLRLGAKEVTLVGFDSLFGNYETFNDNILAPHIIEHTVSKIGQLMFYNPEIKWTVFEG